MFQSFTVKTLTYIATNLLITAGSVAPLIAQEIDADRYHLYQASLAAAEKSLRLNEIDQAHRWLSEAPVDFRGWEWRFLSGMLDDSTSKLAGLSDEVTAIDASPDGAFVAIAYMTGRIEIRQTNGWQLIREIGDHGEAVYSICFSPDGKRLASVSRDVTARIWDVTSGHEISQLKLDNPGVAATTFSPDGRLVATCTWLMEGQPRSVKGVVCIWNADTGEVSNRSLVGVKPLDSIAWSNDGQAIVVGSWDGLVHVLNAGGQLQTTLRVPDEGIYHAVMCVALNHDASLIAAGSKDRTARVWKRDTGELIHTLRGHSGFVNELAFSPTSNELATAAADATIRLWNLEGARITPHVFRGHTRSVEALAWFRDGSQLLSAARDQTIRTWSGKRLHGNNKQFVTGVDGSYTTTFSPDGQQIYVATYGGHVKRFDANTGEETLDLAAHDSSCNTLALSSSGDRMLTCSWDETAKLWSLPDCKLLHQFEAGGGVYDCDLSANATRVALCVGSVVQLWNAQNGEKIAEIADHKDVVRQVVFSHDGQTMATASADKRVGIWNGRTGEPIAVLAKHVNSINALAFSHDNRWLASGDSGGEVILWSIEGQQEVHRFDTGDRGVRRLAFSPDGRRIAAGSNLISILDPHVGSVLLPIRSLPDDVWHLAFSPQGDRIAACTTGGVISVNRAPEPNESAAAGGEPAIVDQNPGR